MADDNEDLLEDYFGGLAPSWSADDSEAAEDERRYVDVPVTRLYDDPLYGKPRGVRYDQGLQAWVRLPLFSSATGAPLTIAVGSYSEAPVVDVRIQEASGLDPRVFEPDEAAELASDGRSVSFAVPPEVADCAGVYRAQVRVADAGGTERARDSFWVYVDRGLWTTDGGIPTLSGLPTFDEIRTAVRDHPAVNRLLADYEFDAAEIGMSVAAACQRFNSDFPPLPKAYLLRTTNIPGSFRDPIRTGTLSYLFETAAAYFRRGHLPYSAGGLAVDDLNKEKDYQAAVDRLRAQFERWVRITRAAISTSAAWGSLGSGMPNRPVY